MNRQHDRHDPGKNSSQKSLKPTIEQMQQSFHRVLNELSKREKEIEAMLIGAQAALKSEQFREAAEIIFHRCKDHVGATAGYIALVSKTGDSNDVLFLDSGGYSCSINSVSSIPIRGLCSEACRSGQIICENGFPQSAAAGLLPPGHMHLENVMLLPLMVEGKAAGIIGLANKQGGFTEHDCSVAIAFAGFLTLALRTSLLLNNLKEMEKCLVAKRGKLEQYETTLRVIFEHQEAEKKKLEQTDHMG
ncbi:MAG TPA: GAF domain-containing protein [Thermodesulfobacteriota bacterium]|nr:GAF domain-containing protein [Thermodesulfobacteriota bacterium]